MLRAFCLLTTWRKKNHNIHSTLYEQLKAIPKKRLLETTKMSCFMKTEDVNKNALVQIQENKAGEPIKKRKLSKGQFSHLGGSFHISFPQKPPTRRYSKALKLL